ncbi:hypothetical protein SODALDRAFT_359394 [Sodiomyces alkalinus F11]|uniref:Uncharacterized protein n=1 Tax=Sodiomyces alkalinus (strain CBS 110278 / VKM F-3762 / F11) TaxID=1314773 RepID=A0A3N2PY97_SODAK|nr:hypothetical protein SODALDRAFT_359394 [Sodiomyces alkalinus F11]ROT39452.1 hypothetical protein SODALDRAFT_359394 [Sodiomyces alkalinus F11]
MSCLRILSSLPFMPRSVPGHHEHYHAFQRKHTLSTSTMSTLFNHVQGPGPEPSRANHLRIR